MSKKSSVASQKPAPSVERPRSVGRPPDLRKVTAIIEAGWLLFLECGVEAVSLEAVAANAGVAKATLYKYFPEKSALFEAGVLREMDRIEAAQRIGSSVNGRIDLRETLRLFGIGIMTFLCSAPAVDFYNSLSGELRRHPALARRFYAAGPGRTLANLTAILAAAASRGELKVSDPERAAEQLFGLWQGLSNFQLSLGVEGDQFREGIAERVRQGIDVFLSAYPAKPRLKSTTLASAKR